MFRALVVLIGAALLAALMAGVYYAPENLELRERGNAFNLAPGEVRQDGVQPSVEGSDIVYEVEVLTGTIDIYVMDKEWATTLAEGGRLTLDRPFSYYQSQSATHVNGTHTFTIRSDGQTWMSVVFDNADNFYAGDAGEGVAPENGTNAELRVTARFVDEEARSLVWGYVAAVPSVLLVFVTFGRQAQRWRRHRREAELD